jgi:hypothetical protein
VEKVSKKVPTGTTSTSNSNFFHCDRPICCLLKFVATPPARNPLSKSKTFAAAAANCFFESKIDQICCRNRKQQIASNNAFLPPAMRLCLQQCVKPSTISRPECLCGAKTGRQPCTSPQLPLIGRYEFRACSRRLLRFTADTDGLLREPRKVWAPRQVSSVRHQLAVITVAAGRIGRHRSSSLSLTLTSNFEESTADGKDVGGVASLAESFPAQQSSLSRA